MERESFLSSHGVAAERHREAGRVAAVTVSEWKSSVHSGIVRCHGVVVSFVSSVSRRRQRPCGAIVVVERDTV